MFRQGPDRQPRRDRGARDPHAARDGHRERRGLLGCRIAPRCTSGWRTRPRTWAGSVVESYLRIERILDAARQHGAEAIHPGYGFLSENADFAAACEIGGDRVHRTFGGIDSRHGIEDGGAERWRSRRVRRSCRARIRPSRLEHAARVRRTNWVSGAAEGGGGRRRQRDAARGSRERIWRPLSAMRRARRERAFGSAEVYVEKLIEQPRHIEIQMLGDRHGNLVHLGERECSIQRRHQKVIEECPSPLVRAHPEMRRAMGEAAIRAARAAGYYNAGHGRVSGGFASGNFYFLEMNTRLQVEHPVTELVTGLDLVRLQLEIAAGERLPFTQEDVAWRGCGDRVPRLCGGSGSTISFRSRARLRGSARAVRAGHSAGFGCVYEVGRCRWTTIRCWRSWSCGRTRANMPRRA